MAIAHPMNVSQEKETSLYHVPDVTCMVVCLGRRVIVSMPAFVSYCLQFGPNVSDRYLCVWLWGSLVLYLFGERHSEAAGCN